MATKKNPSKSASSTNYLVAGKSMPLLQEWSQLEALSVGERRGYFSQLTYLFNMHIGRSEQSLAQLLHVQHMGSGTANALSLTQHVQQTATALSAFDWERAPLNAYLFSILGTLTGTFEHPAFDPIHQEAQKIKNTFSHSPHSSSKEPWSSWGNAHPLLQEWYTYLLESKTLPDCPPLSLHQQLLRMRLLEKKENAPSKHKVEHALGCLSVHSMSLHTHILNTYGLPVYDLQNLKSYTKDALLYIQQSNKPWLSVSSVDILCPLILCAQNDVSPNELTLRKIHPIQIALSGKHSELAHEEDLQKFLHVMNQKQWWESYTGTHPAGLLVDKASHLCHLPEHLNLLVQQGFDLYKHYKDRELKIIVGTGHALNKWLRTAPLPFTLDINQYKKFQYSAFYSSKNPNPASQSLDFVKRISPEQAPRYFLQVFDALVQGGCPLSPQEQHSNVQDGHLLRIVNQQIKFSGANSSPAVANGAIYETIFHKLVDLGLDVTTLLPKKDILDQSASPAIRQLVQIHMEKMELLQALDQKYLQRAFKIAQRLAKKDEQHKAGNKTKRL